MNVSKLLGKVILAAILSTAAAAGFAAPVNINTADAMTLAKNINGIGPKKAQAIVTYRQNHGPFKSVRELTNVKGIGEKILDKNQHDLHINTASKQSTNKKQMKN